MNRWARPGHPYLAGPPVLCAHRGGSKLAPENTLAAFRDALEVWGADMLEMDVHATRDGHAVVIHDPTVDRTTDGRGPVADLTLEALRRLDAGHRFRNEAGEAPFRGGGVRVPTFEEVLLAFPRARLNVEIKHRRAARPLVDVIRRHGAQHRVLLAAQWEWRRWPVRDYEGPWGASREQLQAFWKVHGTRFARRLRLRADIFQVPPTWKGRDIVTRRFVEEAHALNIPVHVWTVDDEATMVRLLDMGVDGIQSDRPDVLARVLTEHAGRPAAPRWAARAGEAS